MNNIAIDDADPKLVCARICESLVGVEALDRCEAESVAFHMTDWIEGLKSLIGVYEDIEKYTDQEVYEVLIRFLVHAPEHVAEASRILTGVGVTGIFRNEQP